VFVLEQMDSIKNKRGLDLDEIWRVNKKKGRGPRLLDPEAAAVIKYMSHLPAE